MLSAALAQATTKLQFLTTIYVLPLREPITVAKSLSTATYLCGDRVILGAGLGWQKAEFNMVAQDFHIRGKRADETVKQCCRVLMLKSVELNNLRIAFSD